ncbi:MAG: class I SAM-dependent methyltransferase [Gemmatimonadota bacterium]|jgi:ubiquinone/menaquinone biosynthesis C-methylase UbiE|nr:class I SAM-dependent methyltransferase [Gemmatimonadota bacterium]MDQ8146368.1 class I SAM-dependent methyltransferase [Gemmatimonadota bacterium]MDQ8148304.1 class I SAM-dependent methyltransferase [Gemmatimonadota bacterium]MDQ8155876.1 class I SAM-dependent methyltransferase [Gemmatimonadota bacterium]MDQ8175841.1 class I SAM-dependent methyltransferase [Gemmatimonadota bacterium]
MDRKTHWEQVWTTKASTEVSWYQADPTLSRTLLREIGTDPSTAILDVGGGDSHLVDVVLADGLGRITVLDLSGAALARARTRLGARADEVTWIEADVTTVVLPPQSVDIWHDRAVFHFLTAPDDRARYAAVAASAVRPGGSLVIATFAADGPLRCSGLEVARYTPEGIAEALGDAFRLVRGFGDVHRTPTGAEQRFSVAVLRRTAT